MEVFFHEGKAQTQGPTDKENNIGSAVTPSAVMVTRSMARTRSETGTQIYLNPPTS
jgi:hypothetical protein